MYLLSDLSIKIATQYVHTFAKKSVDYSQMRNVQSDPPDTKYFPVGSNKTLCRSCGYKYVHQELVSTKAHNHTSTGYPSHTCTASSWPFKSATISTLSFAAQLKHFTDPSSLATANMVPLRSNAICQTRQNVGIEKFTSNPMGRV